MIIKMMRAIRVISVLELYRVVRVINATRVVAVVRVINSTRVVAVVRVIREASDQCRLHFRLVYCDHLLHKNSKQK